MKIHRNVKYLDIVYQLEKLMKEQSDQRFPLESERILAQKLQISRGTLRKALKVLQEKNLINKKDRSGSYLFPKVISRDLNAIHTVFEDIDPLSYPYEINPQPLSFVFSLPEIFINHHQEQGFHKITRTIELLSQPVVYEEHYLPFSLFPEVPDSISKDIFTFVEKEQKLTIAYSKQNITVQEPPEEIANALAILPQKLLHVSSCSYLDTQALFQLTVQYFHPHYHFETTLTR